MVKLGRVSRSGFDRFDDSQPGPDPDLDLRDAIQKIVVEWPSYGRPRITAELRRRGLEVSPKPVYRLMRDDNLLCVRKRKFVVTTDSNNGPQGLSEPVRGHDPDGDRPTLAGPISPTSGCTTSSCSRR
jgi:putative transposase